MRCKEDKFLAGWNQRYLILREFRLDFLKNETGKIILSIGLSHVTNVTRSEDCKMAFEVTRLANPKDAASRGQGRDVPTRTITCEVKNDDEIYDWIDKIYERCPGMGGVSNPTNFSHRVHVGFDPKTGGFVGLPKEWEKLLTASAITKEDYQKNPQAVIEVLEFYSDIKMREQNPQYYSSMTPTPQPSNNAAMQLGHGNVGSSIAPPRPPPPGQLQRVDTNVSAKDFPNGGTPPLRRTETDRSYEQQQQLQKMKEMAAAEQRRREDEARKIREMQRQREDEMNRRDQEAYNASIPQTRNPHEIAGGFTTPNDTRFNPSRAAPPAPGAPKNGSPAPGSLRQMTAQRQAPSAPTNGARTPGGERTPGRQESPSGQTRSPSHTRQNGAQPPPTRLPGPVQQVKPLNVANKQATQQKAVPDGVRQAENALTQKKPEPRQKEVRMSSMTENEVMDKLKQVVSKDNPLESYSKQKKIGQGASGSVYVARVKENAGSPIAREIYRTHGPRGQVAIKQMDLRNQPRKELIVNEIIVMKDSRHPNIVNFLDSFLQEQNNELWVVMEFMEGGALTDVIDNNPVINEDQIATICHEASNSTLRRHNKN